MGHCRGIKSILAYCASGCSMLRRSTNLGLSESLALVLAGGVGHESSVLSLDGDEILYSQGIYEHGANFLYGMLSYTYHEGDVADLHLVQGPVIIYAQYRNQTEPEFHCKLPLKLTHHLPKSLISVSASAILSIINSTSIKYKYYRYWGLVTKIVFLLKTWALLGEREARGQEPQKGSVQGCVK